MHILHRPLLTRQGTQPAGHRDRQALIFGYTPDMEMRHVVDRDGKNLRRLTEDKYADLHPVWSPDGKSIAFSTDRGPGTDFRTLAFGNFRLALYDLDTGAIRVLDKMDQGKNASPQWSPDGKSLAFVSDRDGISDLYVQNLHNHRLYRLTKLITGVTGIVESSPPFSWSRQGSRIVFTTFVGDG